MENFSMTVGRRKSSIAQVQIKSGNGTIIINDKPLEEYVQHNLKLIDTIKSPLLTLDIGNNYDFIIKSKGGGISGQSEAIKLGIARILLQFSDESYRNKLKTGGFLTRNSCCKERRKYGLKKARKASQFSKR